MSEGVELIRDFGDGAPTIGQLPVTLGAFVCAHVMDGSRPACRINLAEGDVSAVCEDEACFEAEPSVTALFRILHFAPDVARLGPAQDGWSFVRDSAATPWMSWAPDAPSPTRFNGAYDA